MSDEISFVIRRARCRNGRKVVVVTSCRIIIIIRVEREWTVATGYYCSYVQDLDSHVSKLVELFALYVCIVTTRNILHMCISYDEESVKFSYFGVKST